MNWGKGIITGMAVFMLFILSMCFHMFQVPADEYDHQYYEKGLSFNADYVKERQVITDHAQPQITVSGNMVKIVFTGAARGTAKLIRPSSAAQDQRFTIDTDKENFAQFPTGALVKGRWRLLLEWESGHKQYLFQQELTL